MKNIINIIISILVCILNITTLIFSFTIYTSLFKQLPWYTFEGEQFLHLVFTTPILFIIIGLINLMVSRNKTVMNNIIMVYPFILIPIQALPVLLDDGLSEAMQYTGALTCLILIICSAILCFYDVKYNRKLSKSLL